MSTNHLSFTSLIGIPTHDRGNTIDLTWASESLLWADISTQIIDDLHITLDHSTFLTHIHPGPGPKLPKLVTTHFHLDMTDKPLFYSTLEAAITHAQALANEVTLCSNKSQTRVLLDHLTRSITSAIDTALST